MKKKKIKKINKFQIFKKACEKYIDQFYMQNWGVQITPVYDDKDKKYKAYIRCDDDSFLSSIFFNVLSNKDSSKQDIDESAKHECIHLILARFSKLGNRRFVGEDEMYAAEEEVVQRLLKIIK